MEQKNISLEEIYKVLLELKAKMNHMDKHLEDIEFVRETREAWERYDRGEFKSLSEKDFLKELEKW